MKSWECLFLSAVTISGMTPLPGATVLDSVNQNASPAATYVMPSQDLGWLYQPTTSYTLDAIQTKFGDSPRADYNRLVTLEIYSGLPSAGGVLLRSATFTPLREAFSGAGFAPLEIVAGQSVFVGFRNVISLGGNITNDIGAASLGTAYSSSDGSFSFPTTNFFSTQPILLFEGAAIPEIHSGILVLGSAAFFVRRRRGD